VAESSGTIVRALKVRSRLRTFVLMVGLFIPGESDQRKRLGTLFALRDLLGDATRFAEHAILPTRCVSIRSLKWIDRSETKKD